MFWVALGSVGVLFSYKFYKLEFAMQCASRLTQINTSCRIGMQITFSFAHPVSKDSFKLADVTAMALA